LRQGDPLSPFLFILGTEVLSRLFHQQESIGLLKGIRIAKACPPINHLLFADDLIIFGKATSSDANSISTCLQKYCSWLGQKVNSRKSSILFSKNTSSASISSILGIIPFKLSSSSPFHLGLPLFFGASRKEAFQPLLDKVLSKLNGWRVKTLSQAGRTVLIKSTAAAIPTYAMSTFLLPSSFCNILDHRFKDFWWGFPPEKARNLCLKSWDSICLPRKQGGLGLRKMSTTNLALITKLGWKFLHSNSLWVEHLQKKYIHYGSFFTTSTATTASWIWKGLQKCKRFLIAGSCLNVSVNSADCIWTTSWVPSLPSYRPSPRSPNSRFLPPLSISDLIMPSTRHWNKRLLSVLFEPVSAVAIGELPIMAASAKSYLWTSSCSGRFSTSMAYLSILNNDFTGSHLCPLSTFWRDIWKLQLTDRLRIFIWKIAWNILPTTQRLQSMIPTYHLDASCPLCKSGPDSIRHLFIHCHFARVVWRLSPWPLDSTTFDSPDLLNWVRVILYPDALLHIPFLEKHRFQVFAAVTCDLLWFHRNKAYHDGLTFDARSIANLICISYHQHCDAWSAKLFPKPEKWILPPLHWYKINFDTAIRASFSCQAAICRDNEGKLIKVATQIQVACSSNKGEALAAQLAVSLASSLHLDRFIIEGDSQIVILALQQPNIVQDWRITDIIQQTLDMFPPDLTWSVRKVNRSANFGAHYVAHWAAARFQSSSIPTSSSAISSATTQIVSAILDPGQNFPVP